MQRSSPLRFLTLLSLVCSIHAPAPARAQAREPALPALLPAEIAGSSTLILPVGVNGSAPRWFILDTGANACVMDEAPALALRLAFQGTGEARGAGRGTVPYRTIATPIRFTTHGVPFTCERVIALDLSGQRSIFGRPIDGILGHDFFARFVTELDWDAQVVRVHDTAGYQPPAGAQAIPLRFERRVPYLEATLTVEGRPPERRTLLLDTGSEDAVDDSLVLKSRGPKRTVTGGVGLGQTYEVTLGRIDRVELGPFELRNVLGVAPGVALIGSGALQKFFFAVDYSRGRLYLEPDPRYFPETSHALVGSGAILRADSAGGVRVHEVLPDTPAAGAGMRAGDRIDRLDGARAQRLGHVRVQKLLDRPGRTYVLRVRRDGAEVRISLRS